MSLKTKNILLVFVLLLECFISVINCQLHLPAMPGPPYPDPEGQNRWGVKFDPKLHGPPFDRTKLRQNLQDYQSQGEISAYPNLQSNLVQPPRQYQPSGQPVAQNPNLLIALPFNKPKLLLPSQQLKQQGPTQNPNILFWNAWNAIYNQNQNHAEFGTPNGQLVPQSISQDQRLQQTLQNSLLFTNSGQVPQGQGSQQLGNWAQKNVNSQVASPSGINYAVNFQLGNIKGHKRHPPKKISLLQAALAGYNLNGHKGHRRPKQHGSFKVFTTLGRGLDFAAGGVDAVRRIVKGKTGTLVATGVKLGGKIAYVGAKGLAKVIKKVSHI